MSVRWRATVLFAWALCGCDGMQGVPIASDGGVDAAVDPIRLNHIQMRGTVNSVNEWNLEQWPEDWPDWDYSHLPFEEQATTQGIRQFDIDILGDPIEGSGLPVWVDGRAWMADVICVDFWRCVERLRDWSDANPGHAPLVFFLAETLHIEPIIWGQLDRIEGQLIGLLGRERLIAPAEVRGDHPDLATALSEDGWPPLEALRGRVMVVLNDRARARQDYLERGGFDPTDRLLFVIGDPGSEAPDEVVYTFDPATDGDLAQIEHLSRGGFLVHASTDDPTMVARLHAAGAHFIATRFPDAVLWPMGEGVVQCNPQTAPDHCETERLEALPAGGSPDLDPTPDGGVR